MVLICTYSQKIESEWVGMWEGGGDVDPQHEKTSLDSEAPAEQFYLESLIVYI